MAQISCNDCLAFQRFHIAALCAAESFTRLACVMNTTFREKNLYQMVLHRPVELAPVIGMWHDRKKATEGHHKKFVAPSRGQYAGCEGNQNVDAPNRVTRRRTFGA